jgi:hypothetical protein
MIESKIASKNLEEVSRFILRGEVLVVIVQIQLGGLCLYSADVFVTSRLGNDQLQSAVRSL